MERYLGRLLEKDTSYFGSGEAFLWKVRNDRTTESKSIIDQAQLESEIEVYPWTRNNYFLYSSVPMIILHWVEVYLRVMTRQLQKMDSGCTQMTFYKVHHSVVQLLTTLHYQRNIKMVVHSKL